MSSQWDRLLDAAGNLIKTAEQGDPDGHGAPDHEDTGEKGYNYRSERFFNRLQRVPSIDKIFDSAIHGDPATPILQAYTNEHVIIRLLMPGDKPRNISFVLHGHRWQVYPNLPSRSVTIQGAISVGGVYTIDLSDTTPCPGDYLYRSGSLRWDVESGMWGILRVIRRSIRCRCECLCQKTVQWWEKLFTER
ncbi:MAG: hypothetical protein ACLTXL_11470 [Clostridia bacterium]